MRPACTQLHAECTRDALRDAGLDLKDVDGYFCAGDAPGGSPLSMAEHLNLDLKWIDGTELGGCSYMVHVRHAATAIAQGKCSVALITLAGKPKSCGMATGTVPREPEPERPETPWDRPYRSTITGIYGMLAQRHMHEYGTTSRQLATVKVATARHAQHNEFAALRKPVTVDVLASPIIASPLHRLDCCVITDGGDALVLTSPEIARSLSRPLVKLIGAGESIKTTRGGYIEPTASGAVASGKGSLYAFSIIERADPPYALAYVELDEGPIILSNLVDCHIRAATVGQRVSALFRQMPDGRCAPCFTIVP